MKRLATILSGCALALAFPVLAQEAMLPTPDAKSLGMGGVAMTTLSGSHALYGNSAMAVFSQMPSQVSSSYFGQADFDYYAVTGYYRFANVDLVQAGWRQYIRERGNNDMALDLGYARRIGERWSVGVVARYLHLKRYDETADALTADVSAAYSLPLESVGTYATLRAGAKAGNLGGYLRGGGHTLPTDLAAGVALDTFLTDAHEVTVGVDAGYYFVPSAVRGFRMSVGAEYNLMQPAVRGFRMSVGAEYNLMQLVQLRAGYSYGERRDYYPSHASVGAGLRVLHLRLDFAYLFAAKGTPLRNTYCLSFGIDF